MSNEKYGYGFKFLTPYGSTIYKGDDFYYNLPRNDQKWSDPTVHPEPFMETDNQDCGEGRLHVMNKLSAKYTPENWWVWFVRYTLEDIVSRSDEKTGVRELQLRRINQKTFWKMIRLGYLSYADLSYASLRGADLSYADLSKADLSYADLRGANLSYADLSHGNLSKASLPSPTMVLLVNWKQVSDRLCQFLMKYDSCNHPKPELFDVWAMDGRCPYSNIKWSRSANFQEKRELWDNKAPLKSAYELATMLLKEKCIWEEQE